MALLPIVHFPANILEEKCERVTEFNSKLEVLLDNMFETMMEADGVGLAAPQVGVNRQIAIVEIEEGDLIELINPKIISSYGEEIDVEGCLSFPGLYGTVSRSASIAVEAQDRYGKHFTLEAQGFLARAIQHEIDHLEGVLFTTKVIKYIDEQDIERSVQE